MSVTMVVLLAGGRRKVGRQGKLVEERQQALTHTQRHPEPPRRLPATTRHHMPTPHPPLPHPSSIWNTRSRPCCLGATRSSASLPTPRRCSWCRSASGTPLTLMSYAVRVGGPGGTGSGAGTGGWYGQQVRGCSVRHRRARRRGAAAGRGMLPTGAGHAEVNRREGRCCCGGSPPPAHLHGDEGRGRQAVLPEEADADLGHLGCSRGSKSQTARRKGELQGRSAAQCTAGRQAGASPPTHPPTHPPKPAATPPPAPHSPSRTTTPSKSLPMAAVTASTHFLSRMSARCATRPYTPAAGAAATAMNQQLGSSSGELAEA